MITKEGFILRAALLLDASVFCCLAHLHTSAPPPFCLNLSLVSLLFCLPLCPFVCVGPWSFLSALLLSLSHSSPGEREVSILLELSLVDFFPALASEQ